jgi:hypothetical protein
MVLLGPIARGEVRTTFEHNPTGSSGTGAFTFKTVPKPSRNDAASGAKITIISGERDRNGGNVEKLTDGRLPSEDDQPEQNVFFSQGASGGRIWIDLGRPVSVKQFNTYSRHVDIRGPQVYKLYAALGDASGFNAEAAKTGDPTAAGWKLIASVDTRSKSGPAGGCYGVSVTDSLGSIGNFRHLLLDVRRTNEDSTQANTFFSEIDVIDAAGQKPEPADEALPPTILTSADGQYRFIIDTSNAPDLTDWATKQLGPVIQEWYPKIVEMLPSDGFVAPARVAFEFREDMGGTPAYAAGSRISCNLGWFRRELQREAKGAVVHEMVHVVQQYRRPRREENASRPPGWIVEGIPDYIRWFLYEPQSKGAEITPRNLVNAKYDASYRVTANFLSWASATYDKELVKKLNAAARDGRYNDALWKDLTGKTVDELGAEWKQYHEQRLASQVGSRNAPN